MRHGKPWKANFFDRWCLCSMYHKTLKVTWQKTQPRPAYMETYFRTYKNIVCVQQCLWMAVAIPMAKWKLKVDTKQPTRTMPWFVVVGNKAGLRRSSIPNERRSSLFSANSYLSQAYHDTAHGYIETQCRKKDDLPWSPPIAIYSLPRIKLWMRSDRKHNIVQYC